MEAYFINFNIPQINTIASETIITTSKIVLFLTTLCFIRACRAYQGCGFTERIHADFEHGTIASAVKLATFSHKDLFVNMTI